MMPGQKRFGFLTLAISVGLLIGTTTYNFVLKNRPLPLPGALPLPGTPLPDTENDIKIRVNTVRFFHDNTELDNMTELTFHVLAVRRGEGNSARLITPGTGSPFQVPDSTTLDLSNYSLTLNEVKRDEYLHIYFLAFDEDEQDLPDELSTDMLMQQSLEFLARSLEDTGFLPQGGLAQFFIGQATGQLLDAWREADPIGEYAVTLDPNRSWWVGQTFEAPSFENNMLVNFSVFGDNEIVKPEYVFMTRDVTREVEVTRQVIREIPVTRIVIQTIVPGEPVTNAATPLPSPITLVSPLNRDYKSPIKFEWTSRGASRRFQVVATHISEGHPLIGELIQATTWTTEIPKEQFGVWEWYVVDGNGIKSAPGTFVFQPHPDKDRQSCDSELNC